MKCKFLTAALLFFGCIISCSAMVTNTPTGAPTEQDEIELSKFSIPKEIPATYNLSRSLYGKQRILKVSNDISEQIAEREKQYSWDWIGNAVNSPYTYAEWDPHLRTCFVREINGKDDGVFLTYSLPVLGRENITCDFEIMDTRNLSVLIRREGLSKMDVADIAHLYLDYGSYPAKVLVLESYEVNNKCSFGKMRATLEGKVVWFTHPIEWCRDGDAILFLFHKEMRDGSSKSPWLEQAPRVIGGISSDDPRPWLRFENSNREALSREYLENRRKKRDAILEKKIFMPMPYSARNQSPGQTYTVPDKGVAKIPLMGAGPPIKMTATGPVIHDSLDLSKFVVPKEVPQTYNLSRSLYGKPRVLEASKDISDSIMERERQYTWSWLERTVHLAYLEKDFKSRIKLVRGINGKDDGAFLSFSLPVLTSAKIGFDFEIIDSRDLSILIRKEGLSSMSAEDIARKYLNYAFSSIEDYTRVSILEVQRIDNKRFFGKMQVYEDEKPLWFTRPIEWCRDGDAILFVFQKETPVPLHIDPRLVQAPRVIGGIGFDEPRPWLRFEKSNREELSREYLERWWEERGRFRRDESPSQKYTEPR